MARVVKDGEDWPRLQTTNCTSLGWTFQDVQTMTINGWQIGAQQYKCSIVSFSCRRQKLKIHVCTHTVLTRMGSELQYIRWIIYGLQVSWFSLQVSQHLSSHIIIIIIIHSCTQEDRKVKEELTLNLFCMLRLCYTLISLRARFKHHWSSISFYFSFRFNNTIPAN